MKGNKSIVQFSGYDNSSWSITVVVCSNGTFNCKSELHSNNCKKQSKDQKEHRNEMKQRCVEYKGGRCARCGLETHHYEVYDFHHVDPTSKEWGIAQLVNSTWDRIVVELDKTILLCSNCHRIIECEVKQ